MPRISQRVPKFCKLAHEESTPHAWRHARRLATDFLFCARCLAQLLPDEIPAWQEAHDLSGGFDRAMVEELEACETDARERL